MIGAAALALTPVGAKAGTLVSYTNLNGTGTCVSGSASATATSVDSSVTASNYTNTTTSNTVCYNAGVFQPHGAAGTLSQSFTVTAQQALDVTGFTILGYSNDTPPTTFEVYGSQNGGAEVNLGKIAEYTSFTPETFTFSDQLILSAGDTYAIDIINNAPNNVYSAQYGFTSATLSGYTAVPEPASLTLFGAGLAGLGWLRRRKARSQV
jgi:hypothetical protein